MSYTVYIIYSKSLNKYYTGSCENLTIRLSQHNAGRNKSTKAGIPWIIKHIEYYNTFTEARSREAAIKKMKSRIYIESLINSANSLDANFWSDKYQNNSTQWDLGLVSPPIKQYIDQLTNKDCRILIPGCGNAYEAAYLLEQGFTNITLIDIAEPLVQSLQKKYKNDSRIQIILGDFFNHQGQYDLIIEQTFFCAIDPSLRTNYVIKMSQLIAKGGKLVGLLFNRSFEGGPPFGGNKEEYIHLFSPTFSIKKLETCYNSFKKREESELFMIFIIK
ncbi:MAG: thiopurine S-methyltransferase [Chitinophagaceae bacterium]|nr:MAG: thiopurine S-methyltransferase [Chitinophagaceae bacterium]